MKIALLGHNKFPIKQPYAGGLEMITYLLAAKLKEKGHDVDVFALNGSDPSLTIIPLDDKQVNWEFLREQKENGELEESYIDDLMYSLAITRISESEYDIVHNHSMHHLPLIWAGTSSKPVISSFHTPVFKEINLGIRSSLDSRNQHFTMVSEKLGKIYKELVPEYEVVHNGIEVKDWRFSGEPREAQVCWIGRICKEKSPHKAVELALRANKKIVLAGPISEENYYKNFFEPCLSHPDVSYLGHLNHTELNDLLGASAVTLFTSIWEEPYGLVIAESLACGTPVVSWDIGAASEIISKDTGRVVPAFKEDLFVKAIQESSQLKRSNCRKRAENFCDVSRMVEAYERIYGKLVKNENIFSNQIMV